MLKKVFDYKDHRNSQQVAVLQVAFLYKQSDYIQDELAACDEMD